MLPMDTWAAKLGLILALTIGYEIARRLTLHWSANSKTASLAAQAQVWREGLGSGAIVVATMFLLIHPFVMQPFFIPSASMENTLQWQPSADRILVSRLVYRLRAPRAGEIVVFRAPLVATQNTETPAGSDFIKRCMGTPGDVVWARRGQYFRNGALLKEPYTKWSSGTAGFYDMKIVGGQIYWRDYDASGMPLPWMHAGESHLTGQPAANQGAIDSAQPEAVPPGQFLMLGDHRDRSSDSHLWGFVPRENIAGKPICIFWPLRRIQLADHFSAPATAVLPSRAGKTVPQEIQR